MNNALTIRLAIRILVFCFFFGNATLANAAPFALAETDLSHTDDYLESPCEPFPPDEVFDSFEKAFSSPEKVKCLNPNVEGDAIEMKHLPPRIGSLVNLQVLSLSCLEKLQDLPQEIGNLRKLQQLIIDNGNGCAMNVTLPSSIGKLENLRVLKLYGALDPRDIGLEDARRPLKFKPLPNTIGNLRKLEVLDLGRNGLKTVPAAIASLTQLKTLRLEYNDLRSVPDFVGNFKVLKELSLNSNKIADLPQSLAKLSGLKVFLGDNGIKLKDQKRLRKSFPKIDFSFANEFD